MWELGLTPFFAAAVLAADTTTTDPLTYVLNFGILGIFFFLVGTGKIFVTRRELDEAKDQRDRAIAERDKAMDTKEEQNKYTQEKVIPLLSETTRVLVEISRGLQITPTPQQTSVEAKLVQQMDELNRALKELKRQ